MSTSNKAQISIFIIVSTIIVLVGIAFLTFSSDFRFFQDQTPSFQVSEFVEACIDQQLSSGIEILGRQGGWIYLPDEVTFAKQDDPRVLIENAKGIDELGADNLAYWYYFDDTSNTYRTNYIPGYDGDEETSMKSQLKRYLDETLENQCLYDFEVFDDAYIINYQDEIDHNVEFRDEEIRVELELPLEVIEKSTNTTEYVSSFFQEKENKLRVPYYLARDIANAQSESSFIESKIMQILRAYMSKETRDLLPPTYDFSLSYDSNPWLVSDIEKVLKQAISSNLGKIQLLETNAQEEELPSVLENSDLAQGILSSYSKYYLGGPENGIDHSLIRESEEDIFDDYSQMIVNPTFETFYPLSVEMGGSGEVGNVIVMPRAQYFAGIVPIAMTTYESSYELHGPVVFSIRDSRQSPNDNFEFKVAYEINIQNNMPQKEAYPILEEAEDIESEFTQSQSLICDRAQFQSELVTLNLVDPITQSGVENAMIEFSCKNNLAQCSLGQTSLDENDETQLSFRLPVNCDPGSLKISKLNSKSIQIDNLNPTTNSKLELGTIEMPSAKSLNLDISMRLPEDVGNSQLVGSLSSDDSGLLIMQHITQEDFVKVVRFNSRNIDDLSIDLIPGEYSIEAFVIREDENNIIQKEEDYECYPTNLGLSEECVDLPEIELPIWITGSFKLDSFEISQNQIINSDTISIKITEFGMPQTYDELNDASEKLQNVETQSSNNPPVLS